MTTEECALIESQFENLAKLFETQLKSSQEVICGKMISLQEKFGETKVVVDEHIYYHNSLNRRIVGFTLKSGLMLFIFIVFVVIVLGVKDGVVPLILAKMLG